MPATAFSSISRAQGGARRSSPARSLVASANISQGLEKCLYIGNIDALRDWGHAKDYVRMQWMMLQQDAPEDFVIATGVQSVREFIGWSAAELGIALRFEGEGVEEQGIVDSVTGNIAAISVKPGDVIVRIDPRYFRPAEVESLLGDPTKAREKLGWVPRDYRLGKCRGNGCRRTSSPRNVMRFSKRIGLNPHPLGN